MAEMVRLMVLCCCRMSYHCKLTVSGLPLRKLCESWAFHTNSFVFIELSLYPRLLFMPRLVARVMPQGNVTLMFEPYEKSHVSILFCGCISLRVCWKLSVPVSSNSNQLLR